MLKGSTAHRAYILEVDRDAQGTKGADLTRKTDQAEIYRGELAELAHALTEIVQSPRGLRWMLTGCDADALVRRKLIRDVQRALALVVAVAFTAPATADAATFLALLSPAVTVLAPLAHDGDKDDLGLLAGGGEALVECFEGGVVMPGAEGRHLEDIRS